MLLINSIKGMVSMEELLNELKNFVERTRELNKERPYLSDYEVGCSEGKRDLADDLEDIIGKFK